MQGDFSVLVYQHYAHRRGVVQPAQGVLRNLAGVLHQQGRVVSDADLTDGELMSLQWQGQAGRDIIGAGVCAVPADASDGFRVESAAADGDGVRLLLHPGRAWTDGILAHLPGIEPNAQAPVERYASYFGPPWTNPTTTAASIGDGVRDAVILEVSEEALHGFQYPERLIEPALGGVDTAERAYVNYRLRLLRLADGEDCRSAVARLRDDPATKGRLNATLAPVVAIAGECPVVGGGGYTGFEHNLYRIEIADTPPGAPARFKWSQWNGGLVGRGRFDATVNPRRVIIDAGRAAIVSSGLTDFYLEALQYDERIGAWQVVYGTNATLDTDHDLELAAPAAFGSLPTTTEPVFFRLWNGVADIANFPVAPNPASLRDGIRLEFDAPAGGNYRPGDWWTFTVRAGEIANPAVLVDRAPPRGILYHRVALAEIEWTARADTAISGMIEDCRQRFRPLTNQKICCTFLVGDGVTSFGDFDSLEQAAAHLPAAGGELCLLPGLHRANLLLEGRRDVKIHGCRRRTLVLPRTQTRDRPILHFAGCTGIEVCDLDLVTYDGIAVRIDGERRRVCKDIEIHDTRMIARTNAIRATDAAELCIRDNRLHLLDTVDGLATISLAADDVRIERNTLVLLPFVDTTPDQPDVPDDDPTRDPADPCARPAVLYLHAAYLQAYANAAWGVLVAELAPEQPYRATGGIHVRAGCERVRIADNRIVGGNGNGITLGGDLDPPDRPAPQDGPAAVTDADDVIIATDGQFLALVQDQQGRPVSDVDVFLEADAVATDRSDYDGLASIKTTPGTHTLSLSPRWRIASVAEARDDGQLVHVIVVAEGRRAAARGFIHEITIAANDIAQMGLSGIGFASARGAQPGGAVGEIPRDDPRGAVLAYIDQAIAGLALTPLLRATDPVRDLVIEGNRIHHNLRTLFDDAMLREAQSIGRGGISLAVVESATIRANLVYDNGPRATDPVCGVFVGYGNDLDIGDNTLSENGAVDEGYEDNRRAGLRGGVYVRFAGALKAQASASTGRKPALRLHDNRIDQPAGRALTAFAFGPVEIVGNHCNSEYTGLHGFVDAFVGGALVVNFGGIHQLIARQFRGYLPPRTNGAQRDWRDFAGARLPGGETLFDDNYVRLGAANRSVVAHAIATFDDLGYASNTASVCHAERLFANALLFAETSRATASRWIEGAEGPEDALSALAIALRANLVTSNQGDHCIVTRPAPNDHQNLLPTILSLNQVLHGLPCWQFNNPQALPQLLERVLAAHANAFGGYVSTELLSSAEFARLPRMKSAQALLAVDATQTATFRAYQFEAARLEAKHGNAHPLAATMNAQAEANRRSAGVLAGGAEAFVTSPPAVPKGGAAVSGRVVNDRGRGLLRYVVELMGRNGERVAPVGRSDTGGWFGTTFDAGRIAELQRAGELSARVLAPDGRVVLSDWRTLRIEPDVDLRLSLVVALRNVPRSVVATATTIHGAPVKPPVAVTRTPLARLKLDAKLVQQLTEGGINDVEDIVETSPRRLLAIVGDEARAKRLVEEANRLLTPAAPATAAAMPESTPKPPAVPKKPAGAGKPSRRKKK